MSHYANLFPFLALQLHVYKSQANWALWAGFYYIDYSLQNPGEGRKYLYSALGMASNGWYNRLYTVTGQVHIYVVEYLQQVLAFFLKP